MTKTNKMFTESNPKLEKGLDLGYLSFGLHFAPHTISGYQVCASASAGCAEACLYSSGHGKFTRTQEARIAKTVRFFEDRVRFLADMVKNVEAAVRRADKLQLLPAFRLNLTSDVRWETVEVKGTQNIMDMFNGVQFYDYTKHTNRRDLPSNYHLTFSRSESNDDKVEQMFAQGYNVAIVFDTPKNKPLPTEYKGRPVIDGRTHDLRFLDPQGVWVGLSALGEAKKDDSGFVILTSNKGK
jgi:hypothetical protein